jgi:hypothetical protein
MDPVTAVSIVAVVGIKLLYKNHARNQLRTETERTSELILTLLRDGYSIQSLHFVAKKCRAWTLEDPTEAEWQKLFTQGNYRHAAEVKELVDRYKSSEATRALVKAVLEGGEVALKKMRVQRAKWILPELVEAGYDIHQLMNVFNGFDGQCPGEEELTEALRILTYNSDATKALKGLAVELGQLYMENGDVSEVVGRVAEVGLEVLDSGWELLQPVAEFFADWTT